MRHLWQIFGFLSLLPLSIFKNPSLRYELLANLYINLYLFIQTILRSSFIITIKDALKRGGYKASRIRAFTSFGAAKTLSIAIGLTSAGVFLSAAGIIISSSFLSHAVRLICSLKYPSKKKLRFISNLLEELFRVFFIPAVRKLGRSILSLTRWVGRQELPLFRPAFIMAALAVALLNFHVRMNLHYAKLFEDNKTAYVEDIAVTMPEGPEPAAIEEIKPIRSVSPPPTHAITTKKEDKDMPRPTPLGVGTPQASLKGADKPLRHPPHPTLSPRGEEKTPSPSAIPDMTRGSYENMELSFTFDGGSEAKDAKPILDALRHRGIKTTIFLTGGFIKNYPDMVRLMLEDGHEIGNHTTTHPHLTYYEKNFTQTTLPHVTKGFVLRELKETERLFREATGEKMAPLWRAPYGEINGEIRRWAFDAGYMHMGWTTNPGKKESLDTLDWVEDPSSRLYLTSAEITDKILNFGKDSGGLNGGIVLMHLSTERQDDKISQRLGTVIDALRTRGYGFVKVSQLMEKTENIKAFLADKKRIAMREKEEVRR